MEKFLYGDLFEKEGSHWWHITKREICMILLKKFIKVKKPSILDLGCGTGANLSVLSKIGEAWGVDSSKDAVNYCRQKGLKNVRLATTYKTGFGANRFDLVTLLDVLEHTDDLRTLSEVRRILKEDGFLLITVPAFGWLWSRWDVILRHRRRYTRRSLEVVLTRRGFKILKISYMYSFLILPVIMVRLIKSRFGKNYDSDFNLSSSIINKAMLKVAGLERWFLLRYYVPFGTSIICVAQKV